MYFGSKSGRQISTQILDRFIYYDGTFLDTANIYAHWMPGCRGVESETFLVEYIQGRRNKEKFFIATKTGISYLEPSVV